MLFIGDNHGHVERYRKIIRGLPEGAKSLQLGDFGLGFKGVHHFPGGSMARGWHKFIRGNHDSPEVCRKHPLYLGDYGYLEDEKLFYLGGAWSIDKDWRVPGISWWEDEELSYAELDSAYQLYVKSRPQIVATHEAPSKAAWTMLDRLLRHNGEYQPHPYCPTDQTVAVKGDEYAYYKAKLGCVNTRTSQALQRMFEEWQPLHHYFGHYHLTTSFKIGRTQFHCLGELATEECNLDEEVQQVHQDKGIEGVPQG
jgi:hypothetical protein